MTYSTQYLYNIQPAILADMLYPEALQFKIDSANSLLAKLYEPHFTERDTVHISAVYRAIKFNEALLSELKESN